MTKVLSAFLFLAVGMVSMASMAMDDVDSKIIHSKNAVLSFCPSGAADCGGVGINVNGKDYRVYWATQAIADRLSNIEGAYKFHNVRSTPPFAVSGYLSSFTRKSGGWGPPGKVIVFVITDGLQNVSVPRGL